MLAVHEDETEVIEIIKEGMDSFETNIVGPDKYLEMYREYFYILNGEAENWVKGFMGQDELPFFKVDFITFDGQQQQRF